MSNASSTACEYGLFVCITCRDTPGDECGDSCSFRWVDWLPPLWEDDDAWPVCKCCGGPASLVAPLVALEV
jgi:hypothetical protein